MFILILGVIIAVCGEKAYNKYQENKQQKKKIGYQKVRAEKLGGYIAVNFADKKILVLTSAEYKYGNGNLVPNHLLEGLKKGLGSVSCDVIASPVQDEAMEEIE